MSGKEQHRFWCNLASFLRNPSPLWKNIAFLRLATHANSWSISKRIFKSQEAEVITVQDLFVFHVLTRSIQQGQSLLTSTHKYNHHLPTLREATPMQTTPCQGHFNLTKLKRQRTRTISGTSQVMAFAVITLHTRGQLHVSQENIVPDPSDVHRRESADNDKFGQFGGGPHYRLFDRPGSDSHDSKHVLGNVHRKGHMFFKTNQSPANIQARIHRAHHVREGKEGSQT